MVVNVIHKPSKHWATLKSRVKVLKLLWSKKKVDYYTLEFSESCLQAPTNAYNKILGTSKYPYPRWGSSRLAWKNNGDGSINVAVMREDRKGISFQVIAIVRPFQKKKVAFTKEYWMPINTPYLGGSDTANVDIEYNIS